MFQRRASILLLFYSLLVFEIIFVWSDVSNTKKCKAGQCENNGVCVNETCLCKDGWTGSFCQFCDGRFSLTEEEGELHDGAGPYSLNTKCSWLIDANSTKPIKLTFHHFSTECGWDHLHVFDGPSVYSPLVGSFSGISKNVKDVVLHSGKGFLYFFSDIAYNMGGFNLTYRLLHCTNDCSGHGVCNVSSETCSCEDGWMGDDCSTNTGCPSLCSSAGTCVNGTCICNHNRTGEDCSISLESSISWRPIDIDTNTVPIGRASMGADTLGNSLYVYGGETLYNRYTIHSNISVDFVRLNIITQTWQELESNSTTEARFGHTLSADISEKKLYLYGGTVNGIPTSHLSSYDVMSDSWQVLTGGLLAVTGHTAHIIDGLLYIFFGQSAEYSFHHPIQVYNITNDSWSMLSTNGVHARGRYGHSSVHDVHSNSVFVFGGYHGNSKAGSYVITNYAYRFLVETSTWVGLTPAPYVAYLHSAVLLPEGYMLVSGGNSHNDTAGSSGTQCYSSTLLAYDICCDRWTDVSYVDDTERGLNRYGHKMYMHDGSVYIFGGFNGVMLKDMERLFAPNCTEFTTSESDCVVGGLLTSGLYNHSLCQWSSVQGCVRKQWTGSCDVTSCERSEAENKVKCDQFTDCVSCLSTDDCYYKSSSSDHCGVVPPPANVNPALQDVSTCGERVCEIEKSCDICNSLSQCIWSAELGGCIQRRAGVDISKLPDSMCGIPCHTQHSCGNCTSNGCLWCESQSLCIDSNSYLTYFPYGQCLEWTTMDNKCVDVSCEQLNSCSKCHRNAMCGWCNDPSNTGKGRCMNGGLYGDLNSTCSNTDWHFTSCPACQCNGHSICDYGNNCVLCHDNTTGPNCETCALGFFGDPANGGLCQRCDCDGVADECESTTGSCLCRVQGATGDRCDSCDHTRQYTKDTIYNEECYYRLTVDYRYTFNFSKPEDKYISRINMQCHPNYADIDIEFTIECMGYANSNLTLYSASYPGKYKHFRTVSCPSESRALTISHIDYEFSVSQYNATLLLILEDFSTPFVFKVSFTQHSRIDLMLFLLIFFGCFLALLTIAGLSWKIRGRYLAVRRQSQARQERRVMASRPFSSIILSADDLKSLVCHEQQLARQLAHQNTTSVGEPLTTLQRTFSKRSKRKQSAPQHNPQTTAVGFELLEDRPAAVATVLVKLPTGGEELPGYDCSGLAFGSTLVAAGSNINNYASSKVVYKHGKVTFKPPSMFHSS